MHYNKAGQVCQPDAGWLAGGHGSVAAQVDRVTGVEFGITAVRTDPGPDSAASPAEKPEIAHEIEAPLCMDAHPHLGPAAFGTEVSRLGHLRGGIGRGISTRPRLLIRWPLVKFQRVVPGGRP